MFSGVQLLQDILKLLLKKHRILEVVGISQVQPLQFIHEENKDREYE